MQADPLDEAPIPRHRIVGPALCLLGLAFPLTGQRIGWNTRAVLYGDNTEFFTPYRVGETIFGGQVSTWIAARPEPRIELRIGAFADRRWGSSAFADSVKPILSARYRTRHSLGILGTLETVRRHGLLEPLMVTTRELTTPIEYGGQWIEQRGGFSGEVWINWQKLNTPTEREQFELGSVLHQDLGRHLRLEAQHLWYHRGGQLYSAGVPVTNNHATAVGARVTGGVEDLGKGSLALFQLWSEGHIDPDYPAGRPDHGRGTWLRLGIEPKGWFEVFGIRWWGHDFSGDAGDNNYNSTGHDPSFYRSDRRYIELGILRRVRMGGGVTFDGEIRWHRIDHEKSIAFFNTPWELSYRLVLRAPIDVVVRRR